MALTRAKKTEKVKALASELEHSTSAIVGTFTGLTAAKDTGLRKAIRGAGGSYHVVKNKLVALAGEGTQIEAALLGLKGVAIVSHGSSNGTAIKNAIRVASEFIRSGLNQQIEEQIRAAREGTGTTKEV